ncbi:MAG TPA: hypothetical protein VIY54_07470 [Steroidobacteraceae bacterium]
MLNAIALRKGPLTVGIAPEAGGSLSRFDVGVPGGRVEILRSAVPAPWRLAPALNMSSFPLLPYAGRLRAGRFEFETRKIVYPLNALPERHSSHGDGFTQPWTLARLTRHEAILQLLSAPDAPIRYAARQAIALHERQLDVILTVRNIEERRVPFEVGFHPYFAHRHAARLSAHLPGICNWDTELMPTTRSVNPRAPEFAAGMAAGELPEACEYFGWDGRATIEWPAAGVRVTLVTDPALSHVVIWAPAGEDFFCFEPLSHATDSFNRCRADPQEPAPRGFAPGESLRQVLSFRLELL